MWQSSGRGESKQKARVKGIGTIGKRKRRAEGSRWEEDCKETGKMRTGVTRERQEAVTKGQAGRGMGSSPPSLTGM